MNIYMLLINMLDNDLNICIFIHIDYIYYLVHSLYSSQNSECLRKYNYYFDYISNINIDLFFLGVSSSKLNCIK